MTWQQLRRLGAVVTTAHTDVCFLNFRNDKALNNQGFIGTNMAEAMGFELMDLLQSTVFKTVALNHSATPPLRCGRHNT